MPWLPELFTAPALQQILDDRRRDALLAVPYFDGLLAGDPDPLVESFAGEPEVYDPVRGRIKGEAAFRAFVAETSAWLRQHHASVDDVEHVILERRGFEEVVLHLDPDRRRRRLPVAVVADRRPDGRIEELRVYFTGQPVTGPRGRRPPPLQPDPELPVPQVVAIRPLRHPAAPFSVAAVATMADLDKLALALPEVTKELDDGRPAYKVAGKTFCFHRSPRPDALDPETGERLDDVLVFWVEDLEIKDILVESAASTSRRRTGTATRPCSSGSPTSKKLRKAELRDRVEEAWLKRAPKKLAKEWLSYGLTRSGAPYCRSTSGTSPLEVLEHREQPCGRSTAVPLSVCTGSRPLPSR